MALNRKTHIHVFGENDLAFLSQIAFFCKALRRLYGPWEPIRVRCFLGGPEFDWRSAPAHIRQCRNDIEIITADPADYAARSFYAQCDHAFLDVCEDAEVVVFADADTFWLQRPDVLLETVYLNRAIAGCMAHFPPPESRPDVKVFWENLFAAHVGRAPRFDHSCSLLHDSASPFYVNFGFVAVDAELMRRHGQDFINLVHTVQKSSAYPYFSYQVALALWAARHEINPISVPLHYNFPNDDRIFDFSRIGLQDIIVFHYLRTNKFKRDKMFVDIENFSECVGAAGGRADGMLQRILLDIYRVPEWLAHQEEPANDAAVNAS